MLYYSYFLKLQVIVISNELLLQVTIPTLDIYAQNLILLAISCGLKCFSEFIHIMYICDQILQN